MKNWRCTVCGYEHAGDAPPAKCPICSARSDEFALLKNDSNSSADSKQKRWKCIVCDYVHTGDWPPAVCPLCGASKESFVLLEDSISEITPETVAMNNEATARSSLDKLSYGLYIVSSIKDDRINGQCSNTVIQLTNEPLRISVCLNKNNLTHEFVNASGKFAVSILGRHQFDKVRIFGYQSGRNVDKFAGVKYIRGKNGCPILTDCLGYLEASVMWDKTVDVGTHTLFVANVTSGQPAANEKPLTYSYYRANRSLAQQ